MDRLLAESAAKQQKLTENWHDAQRSSKTFYDEIKKLQFAQEDAERVRDKASAELRDLMVENRKITESYESVVNDLKRLQDEMDKTPEITNKELEEKEKRLKYLTEKLNEQKTLYKSLMADHQSVLDLYQALTKERQQLTAKYSSLMAQTENSRPVTPRQNWSKAVELKFMSKDAVWFSVHSICV